MWGFFDDDVVVIVEVIYLEYFGEPLPFNFFDLL